MQPVIARNDFYQFHDQFQSSSSQKAGCNRRVAIEYRIKQILVSILIQPEGRMQPHPHCQRRRPNQLVSILIQPEGRMQPKSPVLLRSSRYVSILIQPEGRMQLQDASPHGLAAIPVSILIQPEGRMQRDRGEDAYPFALFQSSSSQKAGCNVNTLPEVSTVTVFQSSSSQKAGCNQPSSSAALTSRVSILIQPEGRMQHVVGLFLVACR